MPTRGSNPAGKTGSAVCRNARTSSPSRAPTAAQLVDRENIRHLPVVGVAGSAAPSSEPPTMLAMVSMRELLAFMARAS